MKDRKLDWFSPEQIISNAFINQHLQPTGTSRLALIFEICKSAGTRDKCSQVDVLTNWEATWFQDYTSPRPDVKPFKRDKFVSPSYFVNHAVAGKKLNPKDSFYTRSHLGVINEDCQAALRKCISVYASGYHLLPFPTKQGDVAFSIQGNMAKLLAYYHHPFDTSLEYNPLEGPIVAGLARHAIISRDFGFVYEMLKLINQRLDVSRGIRLRAEIGPIVSDIVGNLDESWKPGDPKMKDWLRKQRGHLKKKEGDFAKRGESTAANDLIQQRCTMLVDANLIETSQYGNWAFSKFGDAYDYFKKVHEAIYKLTSITENEVIRWFRSWFIRKSEVLLPLAWNHYLDEIETNRNPATDEDCRRALIDVLRTMLDINIKRIRLIELFSILNILDPDKHFKPQQVFFILQSMQSDNILSLEKFHKDPLLSRLNRRKLEHICVE